MDAFISVFNKRRLEYEKLQIAAIMLTNRSPNNFYYHVGETYFVFGQDWKWTTILCSGNMGEYQALSPRKQEEIILADSYSELESIVKSIFKIKFCPDKVRT